jgi:hypothetical protein
VSSLNTLQSFLLNRKISRQFATVFRMAKGARASTKKANNARLKAGVFGPVESARNERLSAKLLELASQPKPKKEDVAMEVQGSNSDYLLGNKSSRKILGLTEENNAVPVSDKKQAEGKFGFPGALPSWSSAFISHSRLTVRFQIWKLMEMFPRTIPNRNQASTVSKRSEVAAKPQSSFLSTRKAQRVANQKGRNRTYGDGQWLLLSRRCERSFTWSRRCL